MKRAIVALIALTAVAMAQDQAAQQPKTEQAKKPMAKDQKEANLINSAIKETDDSKRLQLLEEWTKDYPKSDFASNRELMYLGTYQGLKQYRQAFNKANEILKTDPNDFNAIRFMLLDVMQLDGGKPGAADLAAAEKVADHVLNDPSLFAASNKPPNMTAAQWGEVGGPMKAFAQRTVAVIYVARKNNPRAETELKKSLALQPNDGQIDQMLAGVLLAQQHDNPAKLPEALFYYARAAAYTGQGSLPAATRQQVQSFLTNAYTTYHGSQDGLPQLLATAKTNPNPPAGFKILTASDVAQAKADAAVEFARNNPALATWQTVKKGLTGENPDGFFEGSVKNALLPGEINGTKLKFHGKLVSMTPANRPKQLVLAVENPASDVTLTFDAPLPGKMDAGADLAFEGVAKAYTKDPYMLTLTAEKDNLEGWKPIPPPHRTTSRRKKSK